MGVNNGGVWKTDDFAEHETCFDANETGSVGDVEVAASNPDVVYVGSGEGIQRPDLSVGDGVYKSTDAGKTWTNMGLHDAQQIGGIDIDQRMRTGSLLQHWGTLYGPNKERGVYRTLDGAKHGSRFYILMREYRCYTGWH